MPAIATPGLQQLAAGLPEDIKRELGAALRAQDTFNQRIAQLVPLLTPGPWVRPSYLNSWVDFSSTRFVRYRFEFLLTQLVVRFEGRMKSGTVASKAFVIGQQYCPAQELKFAVSSNGAFGALTVETNGKVTLDSGNNASADLNFTYAVGG